MADLFKSKQSLAGKASAHARLKKGGKASAEALYKSKQQLAQKASVHARRKKGS